jgi:preprotein translocase subunit SecD
LLNGKTQPLLTIRFDRYGSDVMASWTAAHLGDSMLVLVNGRYLTMPTVNEPLSDGSAQFTVADDAAVRRLLQSAPTEKP